MFLFFIPPPPPLGNLGGGGGGYIGITVSVLFLSFFYTPLNKVGGEEVYMGYIGITFPSPVCLFFLHPTNKVYCNHFVRVSHLCPEDTLWTTKRYATKLGMMVHHHDPECHAKRVGCCLESQDHSTSSDPITGSCIYMVDFLTFCNQIWYSSASSRVWVAVRWNRVPGRK